MVTSPLASTSLPPLSPLVNNLSDPPPSSPRWRHFWMAPNESLNQEKRFKHVFGVGVGWEFEKSIDKS